MIKITDLIDIATEEKVYRYRLQIKNLVRTIYK